MTIIGQIACPCAVCSVAPIKFSISPELFAKLTFIESWLGHAADKPVDLHVTSGRRCSAHNAAVGGAPDSQHLLGLAADIYSANSQTHYIIVDAALSASIPFIEVSPNHIHVDLREGPRRLIVGAG